MDILFIGPFLEVDYDTAGRLIGQYRDYCREHGLDFELHEDVRPLDHTTLFCSAGMQRFKEQFRDPLYRGTQSNIQSCLRVNDLDEVGDGTHGLKFDMMGLFSFREWTVPQTILFWRGFLDRIGITPTHVTIHPDRPDWRFFHDVEVRLDPDCRWSDGDQGGYCTEFYVGDVEIGNIVNTNGDCIDVGFGLDRLMLILGMPPRTREEELVLSVEAILRSGYQVSHNQQGYVLKKLLRELVRCGGHLDHPVFHREVQRQQRLKSLYERLRSRHLDKTPEWWKDTHGIDVRDYE